MTVILVSMTEPGMLMTAVQRLAGRLGRAQAQLLVVRRESDVSVDDLRALYRDAILVKAPDDLGESRMRELAASRASGDILVIRSDAAADDPTWIASLGAVLDQNRIGAEHVVRSDEWPVASSEEDSLTDEQHALATTTPHADSRM